MSRYLAPIIMAILLALFTAIPAAALDGTCYSAGELKQARSRVRAALRGNEVGFFTWCICSQDRKRILWWGEPSSAAKFPKTKSLVRQTFHSLAATQGGCFARPAEEILKP